MSLDAKNVSGRQTGSRVPVFNVRDAASLIPHIRELARSLESCREDDLQRETGHLRQQLIQGLSVSSPEMLVAGISLAVEALRRSHGVCLYDVQLRAVISLCHGCIAQMQTGEGKTFVAIATAIHLALPGRGVHVMTPNSYLAERDAELASKAFAALGMTVGLTKDRDETLNKRRAYDCDATYGTGHEFGFDYLRDQLTLRQQNSVRLGSRLMENLRHGGLQERATMQRGLAWAVVDEADSVMIDDAVSPLVLSVSADGPAPDLQAHRTAAELAELLQPDIHYRLDSGHGSVSLTSEGLRRCYEADVLIPTAVLQRPWTGYVEQALRARLLFRRNVHYVVVDGEVRIVDSTTGRIFEDRSWQDGLHQAIEVREGLTVTQEKESAAQITRQRFFRLYPSLCGMTGTAVGCEDEFRQVYRVLVAKIPLRVPSQRQVLPARFFVSLAAKHRAIAEDVVRRQTIGQPVLVGTQSITDSEAIAELLNQQGVAFELLNGLQTREEAEVVAAAGQKGAVTIATNLAGRGTDIPLAADVSSLGGLHVVVAECQLSGRMDRQLIGRTARQGNPGTAQMFVSAEDPLLQRFGRWLSDAIVREASGDEEVEGDFLPPLQRIQRAAERQQFLARIELLRQDTARDSLFR
ncbi:MAG: hypothetical protein KDA81_15505 [Planctomycetaceae bacterium]|nr:hypothetical protein [Planctomycetaceae bacterium]